MGLRLANPPLIEALVEFRFRPGSEWDWTIPGRLYEKIKGDFPESREVRLPALTIRNENDPKSPQPLPAPERLQFRRVDGSAIVQVGMNLLVVNHLKPYSKWETFRELVISIYEKHRDITGNIALERIGMRYINLISPQWLEKGDGLTVIAPFKNVFDADIAHFYQRFDLRVAEPSGILVHQCGNAPAQFGQGITLDLDFASTGPTEPLTSDRLRSWLDEAHDCIEKIFVQSLSESLFNALKG